ncbi:MAG: hypothetical protein AAGH68_02245 [Pseudomonadota bacterium]
MALLIALVTAFNQVREHLARYELNHFPSNTVTIVFEDFGSDRKYMSLIVSNSYSNTGGRSSTAYVVGESAEFAIDATTFTYKWGDLVTFVVNQRELEISKQSDAAAFMVPYGSVVSRSVRLYPYPINCLGSQRCDRYEQFIDKREFMAAVQLDSEIRFTLRTTLSDNAESTIECGILIDEAMLANLALQDWYTAACAQLI